MRPDNHLLRSIKDQQPTPILDWIVTFALGSLLGAMLAGGLFYPW